MAQKCERCGAADGTERVCEHVLERPLATWQPDSVADFAMACTACAADAVRGTRQVCAACLDVLRDVALSVDAKDLARGYAIADLDRAEALWDEPRHPIPKAVPGRWAKITFSTVPLQVPQHLESMWVRIDKRAGSALHGVLDNEPGVLASVELGQSIEFDARQVSAVDWQQKVAERVLDHVCEICEPDLRRQKQELDDGDEGLLDSVRTYGYHVLSIGADDDGPGFVYTIGLAHLFDHPELIVFGDDVEPLGRVIGQLGQAVCEGHRFDHDGEDTELFENARAKFVPVSRADEEHYTEYLGYGCWFHRSREFPVRQVLWSDRDGRYPGDRLFDPRLEGWQPRLDQ